MRVPKVNRIANFINHSPKAQALLKNINDNPGLYSSISAVILAGGLRPIGIGMLPFKEKKDKTYSQASAVAAAVTEFLGSCLLFIPLKGVLDKASKNLYSNAKGTIFYNSPEHCRVFKSITNRGIKVISLIPLSLMRFSLVKPIVNACFGGKYESK